MDRNFGKGGIVIKGGGEVNSIVCATLGDEDPITDKRGEGKAGTLGLVTEREDVLEGGSGGGVFEAEGEGGIFIRAGAAGLVFRLREVCRGGKEGGDRLVVLTTAFGFDSSRAEADDVEGGMGGVGRGL